MSAPNPVSLLDSSDANVIDFASSLTSSSSDDREAAVALFYGVRDGINYEVFGVDLSDDGLSAEGVLAAGRGFCLHKSILYVAAARAVGLKARLVSGLVHNHLSTPDLNDLVGGQTFLHWLAEVQINDRWIRTTPVFNALMCRLYGIAPLEFDGEADAVHQAFDVSTGAAMVFETDLRSHEHLTPSEARALVSGHHPKMLGPGHRVPERERVAKRTATAAQLISGAHS